MTHDEHLEQHMYDLLSQRGVTIKDIAHIVYDLVSRSRSSQET